MSRFQTWFQQRSVYLLPDSTPVVAQYFDFDGVPRWWFVEICEHGRMGSIVAAVFPNRSVWNYIFQPDRGVCVPQCSDLTIDDLRPASPMAAVASWVTRTGELLALLWAVDGLSDMFGVATAFAA
jgi:hypothetical protein